MSLLALPHCLWLSYWHHQLVLSCYLHQPESHQSLNNMCYMTHVISRTHRSEQGSAHLKKRTFTVHICSCMCCLCHWQKLHCLLDCNHKGFLSQRLIKGSVMWSGRDDKPATSSPPSFTFLPGWLRCHYHYHYHNHYWLIEVSEPLPLPQPLSLGKGAQN